MNSLYYSFPSKFVPGWTEWWVRRGPLQERRTWRGWCEGDRRHVQHRVLTPPLYLPWSSIITWICFWRREIHKKSSTLSGFCDTCRS